MKSLLNISCLRISLCILFCLAGTSFIYTLYAQIPDRVFKTDFRIDPEKKGELSVEIDNLSFFKDDEYTGSFMKGYTLPGLWLQAKAVYYPLEMLKLEAGVHLQRFWGANRYPNMAYQDIAHWKGDQYQKGFHALPWFRAQVALSDHVNIVLGDLYGAANHNLIEPLYNPELNMVADPVLSSGKISIRRLLRLVCLPVSSLTIRIRVFIFMLLCKFWSSTEEERSIRS